ncbi:AraC family transcriptional regulator [Lactovum odontotermitis]
MKTYIETLSPSAVLCMRRTGAYGPGNFKLMAEMKAWVSAHDLFTQEEIIYGIAQDNPALTPPEKCRYDVCIVTDMKSEDTRVQSGTLPGGDYLIVRIPHTSEAVGSFWQSIPELLRTSGRQIDGKRPILERYPLSLVEKGECEFCLPTLS